MEHLIPTRRGVQSLATIQRRERSAGGGYDGGAVRRPSRFVTALS